MESCLCVLNGLVGVCDRWLYGSTVVNRCRSWPTGIYGDQIDTHFETNQIDEHDCHSVNWKGVYFCVFFVKEPNYNIIIISRYSGIMFRDDPKEGYLLPKGQVLTFKYS